MTSRRGQQRKLILWGIFWSLAGIVALLMLRRVVNLGRFGWFALWVGPLALATIAMGQSWPG